MLARAKMSCVTCLNSKKFIISKTSETRWNSFKVKYNMFSRLKNGAVEAQNWGWRPERSVSQWSHIRITLMRIWIPNELKSQIRCGSVTLSIGLHEGRPSYTSRWSSTTKHEFFLWVLSWIRIQTRSIKTNWTSMLIWIYDTDGRYEEITLDWSTMLRQICWHHLF